jgi:hypothetical protein
MTQIFGTPLLPTPPGDTRGLAAWAAALTRNLTEYLSKVSFSVGVALDVDGHKAMAVPLRLATYTVSTRPTASDWPGAIIYVSDGGAGAVFQGSNGSAWVNLG